MGNIRKKSGNVSGQQQSLFVDFDGTLISNQPPKKVRADDAVGAELGLGRPQVISPETLELKELRKKLPVQQTLEKYKKERQPPAAEPANKFLNFYGPPDPVKWSLDHENGLDFLAYFNGDRIEIDPKQLEAFGDEVIAALYQMGIEVRENLRAHCFEFRISREIPEPKWRHLDDSTRNAMIMGIHKRFLRPGQKTGSRPFSVSVDGFTKALDWHSRIKGNRIDPFLEYLESLAPWDGVPRLEDLIPNHFTFEDQYTKAARYAGYYLLTGCALRTYQPGAKLDCAVLLLGDPGLGKSTFFANLFRPEDRDKFFSDTLTLDADSKSQVEQLLGKVIVEVSEMTGNRKADVERLRAFLSRQVDTTRLTYRRDPENIKRMCMITATANDPQAIPSDPHGALHRRFIPVFCAGRKMDFDAASDWANHYRDDLWAEARHRVLKFSENPALRGSLEQEVSTLSAQHSNRNEVLEDRINALDVANGITLQDLGVSLNMVGRVDLGGASPLQKKDQYLLTESLKCLGWEKRRLRVNGRITVLWYPPNK